MVLEGALGQVGGGHLLLFSTGLLLGAYHALEPDHVAAMLAQSGGRRGAPAAAAAPRLAARIRAAGARNSVLGALWGLGHTSAILLVSLLAFALSLAVPASVFEGFEVLAGLVLVALGAAAFSGRGLPRGRGHRHPHAHEDGTLHTHPHGHGKGGHAHGHRSYLIGCLHGVAGSGALVALTASALDGIHSVLLFVLVFCVGSVLSMTAASGMLSVPFALAGGARRLGAAVRAAAGAAGVAIGAYVVCAVLAGAGPLGLS